MMHNLKNTVENLAPIRKRSGLSDEAPERLVSTALSGVRLSPALLQGEAPSSRDVSSGKAANDLNVLSSEHKRAGLAITWARKLRGITQGELASILGVSTTTVCRWERGYVQPRAKIRALLESELSELNSASPDVENLDDDHSIPEEQVNDILQACKLKIAALTGLAPEAVTVEMSVRLSA
jgi:DNA-binding transcriptional regulator YiaG